MKVENLKKIISQGESITVEFKESKKKLNKDVYESVCGFLNRYGGQLFLGVKDNGDIVGVDGDFVEQIKKDFVTSINNPQTLSPTFYLGSRRSRSRRESHSLYSCTRKLPGASLQRENI